MDENGLLCGVDAAAVAEWCCICTFPLKPLCTDHKDKHLQEPLASGLFHYLLPSSATRAVQTMEHYHNATQWLFALSRRQRYLESSIQKLSVYREEMNAAFEDLKANLNDRRTQMNREFDKFFMEVKKEALTAIEETSRHALESFTPVPGLQTLLWSNQSTAADFPVFECTIETFADDAFRIVLQSTFPQFKHLSLKHESCARERGWLEQELANAKAQLEVYQTRIHDLETKCKEEIAKRRDIEAFLATQSEADDWRTKYLALEEERRNLGDPVPSEQETKTSSAIIEKLTTYESKFKEARNKLREDEIQPADRRYLFQEAEIKPGKRENEKLQVPTTPQTSDKEWTCLNCRSQNRKTYTFCLFCDSSKPQDSSPALISKYASWKCGECDTVNLYYDVECSKCHGKPTNTKPSPEQNVSIEEIWNCSDCGILNSQEATRCCRCKAVKKPNVDSMDRKQEGWVCRYCQHANIYTSITCSECYQRKHAEEVFNASPGMDEILEDPLEEQQWQCRGCGQMNSEDNTSCSRCHDFKTDEVDATPPAASPTAQEEERQLAPRAEFEFVPIPQKAEAQKTTWTCRFCTVENPESTKICEGCGKSNKPVQLRKEEPEHKKEIKPGQWECTYCTLINNTKDRICGACDNTRKDLLPPSPPSEEDDKVEVPTFGFWTCEKCHYSANSKFDIKCYKCKREKYPSNAGESNVGSLKTSEHTKRSPKPMEGGETEDWIYRKCSEHNYYWTSKCRKCYEPKEPLPEAVETGQWTCANCGTENSQIRSYCKGNACYEKKPDPSDAKPNPREQPKSVPRFDLEPADISSSHEQIWSSPYCNRKNTGPQTDCEFCFKRVVPADKPYQKEVSGKCETCERAVIGSSPLCDSCQVLRSSPPDSTWKCKKCDQANRADRRECRICGSAMDAGGSKTQSVTGRCSKCGVATASTEGICVRCRVKIPNPSSTWRCSSCRTENTRNICTKCHKSKPYSRT